MLFIYEAYLRMVWLYIQQNEKTEALRKICSAIKGLDNKYGEGMKYHHTKTIAFTKIIGEMMNRVTFPTWQLFPLSNQGIIFSKKTLNKFYSESLLNSDIARKEFVETDINPLPDF